MRKPEYIFKYEIDLKQISKFFFLMLDCSIAHFPSIRGVDETLIQLSFAQATL